MKWSNFTEIEAELILMFWKRNHAYEFKGEFLRKRSVASEFFENFASEFFHSRLWVNFESEFLRKRRQNMVKT